MIVSTLDVIVLVASVLLLAAAFPTVRSVTDSAMAKVRERGWTPERRRSFLIRFVFLVLVLTSLVIVALALPRAVNSLLFFLFSLGIFLWARRARQRSM